MILCLVMARDDNSGSRGDMIKQPSEIRTDLPLIEWRSASALPALGPGDVRVWIVELDAGLNPADDEDAVEPGPELALLAPDEQVRAARFVRARDRRRFARCRAALREILGCLLGRPPGSLRFRAGGQGKPELDPQELTKDQTDRRHALRFNVSHTGELALIAVCRGRELGVDLERVRPILEAQSIVASFFSMAEAAEFASIAEDARALAFFRGWTRKEAILKGLGVGLAGLAARYDTRFGTSELLPWFTPATPSPQVDGWLLWEAAPRAGFVAALALADASLPAAARTP
jgi:4'-phosphopantetheinyl transferase